MNAFGIASYGIAALSFLVLTLLLITAWRGRQQGAQLILASAMTAPGDEPPSGVVPASRFALEVPPCGILPIAVYGLGADLEERRAAALTSELMKTHVIDAAHSELAGFGGADWATTTGGLPS